MRAEEKQLDEDLVHDLDQERELDKEHAEGEDLREVVPEEIVEVVAVEELRDEHREIILATITALFARETVQVSGLDLPKRELEALEYLQAAITGRESLGRFVFAEDRRDLLEHALGVLQPTLGTLVEVSKIESFTSELGVLRTELNQLDEAQETIHGWEKDDWFGHDAKPGDKDDTDKPKTDPDAEVPLKVDHVSTLDGPERRPPAPQPTTLEGDDLPVEPDRSSTLSDEPPPVAPSESEKPGKPPRRGGGGRRG